MTFNTLEILGYIFLFYIGFYFYRLAENHNKNKWVFGILGIVSFIVSYFSYLLFCRFYYSQEVILESLHIISIKSFLSGVIGAILVFQILSRVWSRKKNLEIEVDKIGNDSNNEE